MGKKEKTVFALAEDFKAMITLVPKLKDFIEVHEEIAEGYQKYRKNGGDAIPGIEKHLGVKELKEAKDAKEAVESPPAKKTKKKDKK